MLKYVPIYIFFPSALQSNGLHAKSLFRSSPPLPYKATGYMLNQYLNLPPLPYKAMGHMLSHYSNLPPLCPTKPWATC